MSRQEADPVSAELGQLATDPLEQTVVEKAAKRAIQRAIGGVAFAGPALLVANRLFQEHHATSSTVASSLAVACIFPAVVASHQLIETSNAAHAPEQQ